MHILVGALAAVVAIKVLLVLKLLDLIGERDALQSQLDHLRRELLQRQEREWMEIAEKSRIEPVSDCQYAPTGDKDTVYIWCAIHPRSRSCDECPDFRPY